MHARRIAYLVSGEGVIYESPFLSAGRNGCPMAGARAEAEAAHAEAAQAEPVCAPIRFGRIFEARAGFPPNLKNKEVVAELTKVERSLIDLGRCMNDPKGCHGAGAGEQEESDIPAGYTYLGQFITHEITFDKTEDLPLSELSPANARSPSLDLDSLYRLWPGDLQSKEVDEKTKKLYEKSRDLYEPGEYPARLRVGTTEAAPGLFRATFDNDLPRVAEGKGKGDAIIGDERNDENLPLAQTHVAFIKFHNRVVEDLAGGRYKDRPRPTSEELFKQAREEVVKHFQWIVLHDYLPRLAGDEIVASLTRRPNTRFAPMSRDGLFIPLEFSAAAFRIGHSMVRRRYKWNRAHADVALSQLFTHTKRSGNLNGLGRLDSTWVIDWKRFYDFTPFAADYPRPYDPQPYNPQQFVNKSGRLDTVFDLHLDLIDGFNHNDLPLEKRSITVRNLLRGLALGLPSGEEVAAALGERVLERDELRGWAHTALLDAVPFEGKTPLWFYVLREARVKESGGRLGRVGARIVAETLIGLIRHSDYTILRPVKGQESESELSDWRPAYGRPAAGPEGVKFQMTDLLRAADVVDPLGARLYKIYKGEHPQA